MSLNESRKKDALAKLGSLSDKVVKGSEIKNDNLQEGPGRVFYRGEEKSNVGSSEVFKGQQFMLKTGKLEIPNMSDKELEHQLEILDAGERLIEFAKQRLTDVDQIFSYLMDNFSKESTLGKKKKEESAKELPVIDANAGLSYSEKLRRKKCGITD